MAATTPASTSITVRVQAKGGKFLADDIGGSEVTIRDAQTGERLGGGHVVRLLPGRDHRRSAQHRQYGNRNGDVLRQAAQLPYKIPRSNFA